MKSINLFFLFFILININISAGNSMNYDKYFIDATMRIDYHHTGNSKTDVISVDKIYKNQVWGRSKKNLIDNFNNGAYYINVFDALTEELIFSKGFDSYFKEYQTSENALNGLIKTYHETAIFPFPKNKVKFVVLKRDKNNQLNKIFSDIIDPNALDIIEEKIYDKQIIVIKSLDSGESEKKVDVVILGEGYTESEKEKFEKDLNRFTNTMKNFEPYKSNISKFNIYGILQPSLESGTDEPRAGIFKNTTLNTTFNSLGSERYLLTEDNKRIRDLASLVPYDAVYIMVNHKRYGGGGIYNFYCTFTSDNQFSDYLFLHEFGHSFAGLADEYYTSDVAYSDFYPQGVEPVEPNITRITDKDKLKWKHLLSDNIEAPSLWEKEEYDEMDYLWQSERIELNKKISELKKSHASENLIKEAEEEYNEKDKKHSLKVKEFLQNSKYAQKVGVFEGAGYSSKGMYRPMIDCLMFTKDASFCEVCTEAIIKVINFYCE